MGTKFGKLIEALATKFTSPGWPGGRFTFSDMRDAVLLNTVEPNSNNTDQKIRYHLARLGLNKITQHGPPGSIYWKENSRPLANDSEGV